MTPRILARRVGALALPVLLAACAITPQTVDMATQRAASARHYQQNIDLGGRLSIHYQGTYRPEALDGSFTWSQTPERIEITLLSPLGQTLAMITETAAGASLTRAGQPVRNAADVDMLTRSTLGWPLPVSGLRDWLQGFATDATGKRFVATPRSPDVTTLDGWHLHYANWSDTDSTPIHPRRIDLDRITTQAGDVSLRIVLDTWQAH